MEEVSLNSLDPRLIKQVGTADRAIAQGNPAYALPVCMDILKRHPGCVEVRQVLRKAQIRMAGPASSKKGFLSKLTRAPMLMKGAGKAKKDPAGAMITAEEQ